METYKQVKNVKTKEDFIKFLGLLINDNQSHIEEWEGKNVSSYLESIQSWIEDMEGYYKNNNLEIPRDVNWNFLANIFYVGKIYE